MTVRVAEQGKLLKKIRRKQAQFRAKEPEMTVTFLNASDVLTEDPTNSASFAPSEEVTYHFFIGNGGTRNGISRELLSALLGVDSLCMPESKDFSFASVTGKRKAVHLLKYCNGISIQDACKLRELSHLINPSLLRGPPLHLYLSLVDRVPAMLIEKCDGETNTLLPSKLEPPPGLILIPEFISVTEERELLGFFSDSVSKDDHKQPCLHTELHSSSFSTDKAILPLQEYASVNGTKPPPVSLTLRESAKFDARTQVRSLLPSSSCSSHDSSVSRPACPPVAATLKHRSVKHYGHEFLYGTNTVDSGCPLPGGLPSICTPLLGRLRSTSFLECLPDQLTVNDYLPGAGIPLHVDTHSPFEDGIVSLSLGSQVVMDFRHPDGRKVPVFLPRRSLLIMTGESRYLWTHGITPRKTDEVNCNIPGYVVSPSPSRSLACVSPSSQPSSTSTVISRGRRVSLTFRKVRQGPCTCRFPSQCDSQDKLQ